MIISYLAFACITLFTYAPWLRPLFELVARLIQTVHV